MERVEIRIHGIVQGVGFRPFIHKLVRAFALNGYIKNTSSGVELELEGEREELRRFVERLPQEAPPLAVIEKIETRYSDVLVGFRGFEIRSSKTEKSRNTLISPDICICEDCRRELLDPKDRRYRYPFVNCTNCGPRFTIIRDVPYDRPKTSMASFPMCPDCEKEYRDIEDRRYHAQPDCCPDCGPRVFYLNENGEELPGDAIELARNALKAGKIVAVKGLGGIHLAARADDEEIARTLRRRKQRDEKPFAIMCRTVDCARRLCDVSAEEEKILASVRRPIVLLKKRTRGYRYLSDNQSLGVMLPYTPLHILLMGDDLDALIMTSANLSDTPIVSGNEEALQRLHGIADGYLLHNRDIVTRCDDSLCMVLEGKEYLLRRSRGYVPFPVKLPQDCGRILACGAEQKASFALSKEEYVFQSQHIGDLKNFESFSHYEAQIAHFERLFDIHPTMLACDLHPDYLSTEYARRRTEAEGIPMLQVQHHHAHMASCMADNNLGGEVLALVWDGTGYGTDGTIWGAELLRGGYGGFERMGSILPIPLIGGDRVTKESERVAYALRRLSGCDTETNAVWEQMLSQRLNTPLSSGMGRLFDGVSALLKICTHCSYEGQGAVLLEAAAEETEELLPFAIEEETLLYDWRETVRALVQRCEQGESAGILAAAFMNTLIEAARTQCRMARERCGISRVCLSGGSFQNRYLMERLPKALRSDGFEVFTHHRASTNDEGLSLGQLMIARYAQKEQHVSCNPTQTH